VSSKFGPLELAYDDISDIEPPLDCFQPVMLTGRRLTMALLADKDQKSEVEEKYGMTPFWITEGALLGLYSHATASIFGGVIWFYAQAKANWNPESAGYLTEKKSWFAEKLCMNALNTSRALDKMAAADLITIIKKPVNGHTDMVIRVNRFRYTADHLKHGGIPEKDDYLSTECLTAYAKSDEVTPIKTPPIAAKYKALSFAAKTCHDSSHDKNILSRAPGSAFAKKRKEKAAASTEVKRQLEMGKSKRHRTTGKTRHRNKADASRAYGITAVLWKEREQLFYSSSRSFRAKLYLKLIDDYTLDPNMLAALEAGIKWQLIQDRRDKSEEAGRLCLLGAVGAVLESADDRPSRAVSHASA